MNNIDIYERFKHMYPAFAEMSIGWSAIGLDEIEVALSDGTRIVYDNIENILIIPNKNDTVEEAWTKEFARRLKKRLYLRGLSQERVANWCEVSQPTVSKWLSGKSLPSAYMLTVLAELIGCAADDLIEYEY